MGWTLISHSHYTLRPLRLYHEPLWEGFTSLLRHPSFRPREPTRNYRMPIRYLSLFRETEPTVNFSKNGGAFAHQSLNRIYYTRTTIFVNWFLLCCFFTTSRCSLVPETGLEPVRLSTRDFKSLAATYYATLATGPTGGNRTPIHALEERCPIRWTTVRWILKSINHTTESIVRYWIDYVKGIYLCLFFATINIFLLFVSREGSYNEHRSKPLKKSIRYVQQE